jgi:hypothetical protein
MAGQGRGTQAARWLAATLAIAGMLGVDASIASAARDHITFQLDLTSRDPGTPSGMRIRAGVPDRNGKPPQLESAVYYLPPGFALDATLVPVCSASDDDINTKGRDACPAETRVGNGSLTAVTGFGPPVDPLDTEATIFQGHNEFIEVFTPPGSDRVVAIDHARFGPGTITLHPPPAPGGPPDGHTTPQDIDFFFPAHTVGERTLFRAPPSCPASGWIARVTATYAGGEVESASSTTPCRTASGTITPEAPKRLRLSVTPRRVAAGKRVRFRLRVMGPAECVAAAVVRFHGRRWRTGRDGRRALRGRFTGRGLHNAIVSAKGCRSARAGVRVT